MTEATLAPPAHAAEYSFRTSIFESERHFTLADGAITVRDEGGEQRVPLSDVEEVHLRFHRTKQRDYYQCRVRLRSGRKLFLQNRHWGGIANFEDRSAAYTAFVAALHQELAHASPAVSFRSGSFMTFVGTIMVAAVVALLLVVAVLIQQWIATALMALILFSLLPIIPRSLPRAYAPDALPRGLLP